VRRGSRIDNAEPLDADLVHTEEAGWQGGRGSGGVGGPLLIGLAAQPLVDTFPGPARAGRVRRRRRHPLILTKSCLVASLALPLFLFRRSTSVHPRVAASLTHDARYR
jgi:hypothetical protein